MVCHCHNPQHQLVRTGVNCILFYSVLLYSAWTTIRVISLPIKWLMYGGACTQQSEMDLLPKILRLAEHS